ncbi:hypothetical protein CP967_08550 [Streptomyces nitrosporeus]|uniref:Uncharacterized protein n=1 Tax=Streptomyces nitrosporeus TaxID=28894 RepID=A0A5J6F6M4_9ACTN|nr:hypothetical protein CP967_08550 [Streptomyces nitrosporeus]
MVASGPGAGRRHHSPPGTAKGGSTGGGGGGGGGAAGAGPGRGAPAGMIRVGVMGSGMGCPQ